MFLVTVVVEKMTLMKRASTFPSQVSIIMQKNLRLTKFVKLFVIQIIFRRFFFSLYEQLSTVTKILFLISKEAQIRGCWRLVLLVKNSKFKKNQVGGLQPF